jgi:hypothetical protein
LYAAQGIPQIDTEIAEKGHFWMETSSQPGELPQSRAQSPTECSLPKQTPMINEKSAFGMLLLTCRLSYIMG